MGATTMKSFARHGLFVLNVWLILASRAAGQFEFPKALRFLESAPVTVNEVQFVTIAETEWPSKIRVDPVDIQLRITNQSKKDLIFRTFDTFGIKLTTNEDKPITLGGGRNATLLTKPILIPKGASYTLARKAQLLWDDKTRLRELHYWD